MRFSVNQQDKEAFEEWMKWMMSKDNNDGVFGNYNNFTRDEWVAYKGWQAAIKYKQKEIDIIQHQLDYSAKILTDVQADKQKLQAQLQELIKSRDELRE